MNLPNASWRITNIDAWKVKKAKQKREKEVEKLTENYVKQFTANNDYKFSWNVYLEYCIITKTDPLLMYKKADGLKVNIKQYQECVIGTVKVNHNGFPVTWVLKPFWCIQISLN